jgi:hypothetical protein
MFLKYALINYILLIEVAIKNKKNNFMNTLKELKRLWQEFGLPNGMPKGFLTNGCIEK